MRNCILILFFSLISRCLAAGAVNESHLADSLFTYGLFSEAKLEYSRLWFFSADIQQRRACLNMQAKCLMRQNLPAEALFLLRKQRFVPDSMGRELAITQLQGLLKSGANDSTIRQVNRLVTLDQTAARRYIFYRFLAHFQSESMGAAEGDALLLADTLNHMQISNAFRHYRKKCRNPALAQWLSVVPGLGQLYARDYRNAANSILLTGAIAAVGIWQYEQDKYRGIYLTLLWFPRYYSGGIKNARKSAIFYNNKQKEKLLTEVLASLHPPKTIPDR